MTAGTDALGVERSATRDVGVTRHAQVAGLLASVQAAQFLTDQGGRRGGRASRKAGLVVGDTGFEPVTSRM